MIPRTSTSVILFVLLGLSCDSRELREAREALGSAGRPSTEEEREVFVGSAEAVHNPLHVTADDHRVTVIGRVPPPYFFPNRGEPDESPWFFSTREQPDEIWIVLFERKPEGGLRYQSGERVLRDPSAKEIRLLRSGKPLDTWLLEDMKLSWPSHVSPRLPKAVVRSSASTNTARSASRTESNPPLRYLLPKTSRASPRRGHRLRDAPLEKPWWRSKPISESRGT